MDSQRVLGLENANSASTVTTTTDWVDEKNPPVKVKYDAVNQRLQFTVERNILGTGTNSNFNSFNVYGAESAENTNNLRYPLERVIHLKCSSEVVRFYLLNHLLLTVKKFS